MEYLKVIPRRAIGGALVLIGCAFLLFAGIFFERTYISKEPFVIFGLINGPVGVALSNGIDFDSPKVLKLHNKKFVGEIAKTAGIVTANLDNGQLSGVNGAICGYVGSNENNTTPIVSSSMHYIDRNVSIPYASISMPVRKGEYWKVENCGGNTRNTIVYWNPLTLSSDS